MKKLVTLMLCLVIMCSAFTFAACGARDAFDMTKVATLADLEGSIIAAQQGTFHLNALRNQTTGAWRIPAIYPKTGLAIPPVTAMRQAILRLWEN